jgi:glucosyl-dolichyl phosphate glucuronosyltransferase
VPERGSALQVTVVVPTFRRLLSLRRTLDALAHQETNALEWDVVIVDNDDPPGAAETFDAVRSAIPVPTRLVRERRRGASHARNRGISEVRAPVTVFLDDDVAPEHHWLARLVAPVLTGRADAVAGRVVLDPAVPRPPWFTSSWHDTPFGVYEHGDDEVVLGANDYLNTASAAVRTELLRATGGFDPVLGPRDDVPLLHDDVVLYRRLLALGARVLYVPDAVVVHELPVARLTRRYVIRREYFRGRSGWLSDRERHARMHLLGTGAAARNLAANLREAARDDLWRPSTLYRIAADVAFTAGYGAEAVKCLLHGRAVAPSGAWLEPQDGSSARP